MRLHGLHWPHGRGPARVRHGSPRHGQRWSRCRVPRGAGRPCRRDARAPGHAPEGQHQRVAMARHARGARDTARVAHGSLHTVMTAGTIRNLTSSICTSHCDRLDTGAHQRSARLAPAGCLIFRAVAPPTECQQGSVTRSARFCRLPWPQSSERGGTEQKADEQKGAATP